MNNSLRSAATVIVAAAILTGCAATAVQPVYEETVGGPPPAVVVVYSFAIDPDEVTLDRGVVKQAMEGMENKTTDDGPSLPKKRWLLYLIRRDPAPHSMGILCRESPRLR